jgi:hypothetical protein
MFKMLLGHLVGDYLLQNNWMALNKSRNDVVGWTACTVHCLLYTASVCSITGVWQLEWVVAVFLSHFIIDKFSLAELYCRAIKGRSIKNFLDDLDNYVYTPYAALRAGFYTLVYTVVDNTMHLLLMYVVWVYLFS